MGNPQKEEMSRLKTYALGEIAKNESSSSVDTSSEIEYSKLGDSQMGIPQAQRPIFHKL